jgi:hypothetical protein
MGQMLDTDLSGVRVHTDTAADVNEDVYFWDGKRWGAPHAYTVRRANPRSRAPL